MSETIKKPWGEETILFRDESDGIVKQVKRLKINAGEGTSLQFHYEKEEYILVVKGKLLLRIGSQNYLVNEGMFACVPPVTIHRFSTPTKEAGVELIETSRGSDEDIVRLFDKYGRADLKAKAL